jgi:hypothetical protein
MQSSELINPVSPTISLARKNLALVRERAGFLWANELWRRELEPCS